MRYAVGFYDDAMRSSGAEGVPDCQAVRVETIGRNFRLADDALAQVMHKIHGALGAALADAFTKRGNDFNLLFAGEYVHGSSSFCVKEMASREAGNTAVQGVYCPDGHSLRAHPRGD